MAVETIRRGILKITTCMALGTVINRMPFCQGEKSMAGAAACPKPGAGRVMAFYTVGGEAGRLVVGAGGRLIIVEVAVDTIIAYAVKTQ